MIGTKDPTLGIEPFPGPIPYSEPQWRQFRGRDREIDSVVKEMKSSRLVLLTAPSGFGKTSLIRCGILRQLRLNRHFACLRQQQNSVPAVLLVRDWVRTDEGDADSMLYAGIAKAIEEQAAPGLNHYMSESYGADVWSSIEHDHQNLARALKANRSATKRERRLPRLATDQQPAAATRLKQRTLALLADLIRKVGSLTLIVDQFEELLEAEVGIEAQRILADAYRSLSPFVHFLISFRREYLALFNTLESQLGPLGRRTIFLGPIDPGTLKAGLVDSAAHGGYGIDDAVIVRLYAWMQGREIGTTGTESHLMKTENAEAESVLNTTVEVNLLSLQAVLLELYWTARGNNQDSITWETADRLLEELGEGKRKAEGPDVVRSALKYYIERRALPVSKRLREASGLPSGLSEDEKEQLEARYAAARLAPFFSTGTIKVPQKENELVAKAWSYEWRYPLGTNQTAIANWLGHVALDKADASNPSYLVGLAGSLGLDSENGAAPKPTFSGIARRESWSTAKAIAHIFEISRAALDTLRDYNVVRPKFGSLRTTSYELVHDGFGVPLTEWAETQRARPLDTLTAFTAQRGWGFAWHELSGEVLDACWRGCWVGPGNPSDKMQLRSVEFRNCDLGGTFFDSCRFVGGGFFDGCNLDGVIFRNCVFEGLDGRPFVFARAAGDGLTFQDCNLGSVLFSDCRLAHLGWSSTVERTPMQIRQVVFDDCRLSHWRVNGEVTVNALTMRNSCRVELSDLGQLRLAADAPNPQISGCRFLYCLPGVLVRWTHTPANLCYPLTTDVPASFKE